MQAVLYCSNIITFKTLLVILTSRGTCKQRESRSHQVLSPQQESKLSSPPPKKNLQLRPCVNLQLQQENPKKKKLEYNSQPQRQFDFYFFLNSQFLHMDSMVNYRIRIMSNLIKKFGVFKITKQKIQIILLIKKTNHLVN